MLCSSSSSRCINECESTFNTNRWQNVDREILFRVKEMLRMLSTIRVIGKTSVCNGSSESNNREWFVKCPVRFMPIFFKFLALNHGRVPCSRKTHPRKPCTANDSTSALRYVMPSSPKGKEVKNWRTGAWRETAVGAARFRQLTPTAVKFALSIRIPL